MKRRRTLSVIISGIGLMLLATAVAMWLQNSNPPLNNTVLAVGGAVFLIIGILIFVADLFETFLSRGQTALVDGLQAG